MNTYCDVIRDLLPLYTDDVCSETSRSLVEAHLRECPDCRQLLDRLRETELETDLLREKDSVIQYGLRRFKRRSAAVGTAASGLFMIPILACLVLNFTHGLSVDWISVVIASLIVAASLIVVPLFVPEDKLFWTFCAFSASLMLLLGVTCLYDQGDWFPVTSSAVLFGLGFISLPFLVRARPLRKLLGNSNRLLIVLGLDTALFINMLNMVYTRGKITLNSILFTLGVVAGIGIVVIEILRHGKGTKGSDHTS